MNKLTILTCLLILAGCSHANEGRPAASANDEVSAYDAERSPQAPADSVHPQSDIDSAQLDSDMNPGTTSHLDSTGQTPVAPVTPEPVTPLATGDSSMRNDSSTRSDTGARTDAPVVNDARSSTDAKNTDAKNTGVNKRDRNESNLTPIDQGSSDSDTKITQQIRQSVIDDGSLSFTAKNIKIITQKGKVTLRGPVNNAQERATIETKAIRIAGANRVDNQLEVER
jgi:osmotically-inducible protein OsmY